MLSAIELRAAFASRELSPVETLDYVTRPGLRLAINMLSYVIGFTLLVLGTIIVVTFDPSKWPGAV